MRTLPVAAILVLALVGCAQAPSMVSDAHPAVYLGGRPPVIHVGTHSLPQQIIGGERHQLVLDGLS